jgi:hypothetical protein
MTAVDDERSPLAPARERQEREIAFGHLLAEVEHALAVEAAAVSLIFGEAGLDFDPLTFIALRIVSESYDAGIDSIEVLAALHERGVFERAVEIVNDMRDVDAA